MPSYDYECKDCGHDFEVFQNMSDPVLEVCPKCEGTLRRLISGGLGIIFKGSGFYVTDNKKSAAPSASGNGGNGKTGDSSGPAESAPKIDSAKKESTTTST